MSRASQEETITEKETKLTERQPLSIVLLGHIGVGKSTLSHRISLLTLDEAKKKKENFRTSFDNLDDSWSKGIAFETTRAKFNTITKRITISYASDFRNYEYWTMRTSQADAAALMISAKLGEFEIGFECLGYYTEHLLLLKASGAKYLIILVNKMDEKTINWSEPRYEFIKKRLLPFLKDSCGYDVEKDVYFVPLSAREAENMNESIKNPKGSWYKGPTFLGILDSLTVPDRDLDNPVRLPISDKFNEGGSLFVCGRLECGKIIQGTKLQIVPSMESLIVHAIYNDEENDDNDEGDEDDKCVPYAQPGEYIRGIEEVRVSRGDVICSVYSQAYVCSEIECEISLMELLSHKSVMTGGYNCIIYLHAFTGEVCINGVKRLEEFCKKENRFKNVKYLKSWSVGIVRIIPSNTNSVICCEKFSEMPYLGRFILRDEGKIIASGKILRVKPAKTE